MKNPFKTLLDFNQTTEQDETSCRLKDEAKLDLTQFKTPREKLRALILFQHWVNLISKLGWNEHTNDWDLFLVISTKDGTYYTCSGIPNLLINNEPLEDAVISLIDEQIMVSPNYKDLESDELDELEGNENFNINLNDITSIRLAD
jgi:hypothetical protein